MPEQVEKALRFARLLGRHHRQLIHATFVLARIRWLLASGSYRSAQTWLERKSVRQPMREVSIPVATWSVKHASRLIPGAACLAQALALRYILLRAGEECIIRVGVKVDDKTTFGAHAWVMYKNHCILGGTEEDLRSFSQLVDL